MLTWMPVIWLTEHLCVSLVQTFFVKPFSKALVICLPVRLFIINISIFVHCEDTWWQIQYRFAISCAQFDRMLFTRIPSVPQKLAFMPQYSQIQWVTRRSVLALKKFYSYPIIPKSVKKPVCSHPLRQSSELVRKRYSCVRIDYTRVHWNRRSQCN